MNSGFAVLPNQILINDINQTIIQYQYNLNVEYSNITMRWNTSITDCSNMFNSLNIIKIDFSGFDSSKVTRMRKMFFNCTSLTSVDLSHFNTSACTDMNAMFDDCHSLISIDLSNFDTSHVICFIKIII